MIRQMLKLGRARRAYREGRYLDALQMVEDPEIRDHVKVQKLRERCLEAVAKRAKKSEKKGELSRAAEDQRTLASLDPERHSPSAERDLRQRARIRDDLKGRERAIYFKARLAADRGDIESAQAAIASLGHEPEGEDFIALSAELEDRSASALRLIADAQSMMAKEPGRAEELLDQAAHAHPKALGLGDLRLALAETKVARACGGSLSDGAFSAFLSEYGILRRRALAELDARTRAELEAPLVRELNRRIKPSLDAGRQGAVRKLLERGRSELLPDEGLQTVQEGLAALARFDEALSAGDFVGAEESFAAARRRLGRTPSTKEGKERLAKLRRDVEPRLEEAESLLAQGKLDEAKVLLLAVGDQLPGHRGVQRQLKAIHARLSADDESVAALRRALADGQLVHARDELCKLRASRSTHCELEELSAELEQRERQLRSILGSAEERLSLDELDAEERARLERDLALAKKLGADDSRADRLDKEVGRRASSVLSPTKPQVLPEGSGRGIAGHWLLSLESFGELLVFENDSIVIGNAVANRADLPILANIAARHASISRSVSFHGGLRYTLAALGGRPVEINGVSTEKGALADGDRVKLGRDLEFSFRLPSARSKAALLEFSPQFEVEGSRRIVLLPPNGRAGAIIIGPEDAHLRAPRSEEELEVFRAKEDKGAVLTVIGRHGVGVDGAEARAKGRLFDGSEFVAGELRGAVRGVRLS